jgi:hypothetical protein
LTTAEKVLALGPQKLPLADRRPWAFGFLLLRRPGC